MSMERPRPDSGAGGQSLRALGDRHQCLRDFDPLLVGKGMGDADDFRCLFRRAGQGSFQSPEERGRGRNLRIGNRTEENRQTLAMALQQSPGLQAPEFLAGIGLADPHGDSQLGHILIWIIQDALQQIKAGCTGQYPARPPQRRIQRVHVFTICASSSPLDIPNIAIIGIFVITRTSECRSLFHVGSLHNGVATGG